MACERVDEPIKRAAAVGGQAIRLTMAMLAALLLAGCMSAGTEVDPAKAAHVRSGVTTDRT